VRKGLGLPAEITPDLRMTVLGPYMLNCNRCEGIAISDMNDGLWTSVRGLLDRSVHMAFRIESLEWDHSQT
jgi:hypothetical protein